MIAANGVKFLVNINERITMSILIGKTFDTFRKSTMWNVFCYDRRVTFRKTSNQYGKYRVVFLTRDICFTHHLIGYQLHRPAWK